MSAPQRPLFYVRGLARVGLRGHQVVSLGLVFALGCAMASASYAFAKAAPRPQANKPRPGKSRTLHPQRRDRAPVWGVDSALVTAEFFHIVGSRYNERLTSRATYNTLMELSRRHPRRLRIVFRPIDPAKDPAVARAALEAANQGFFHEFLAEVYRSRSPVRVNKLEGIFRKLGGDPSRLKKTSANATHMKTLQKNRVYRARRRVRRDSQVAVLFNGVQLERPATPRRARAGNAMLDAFEAAYDDAYSRALAAVADGIPHRKVFEFLIRKQDLSVSPVVPSHGIIDGHRSVDVKQAASTRLMLGAASQGRHSRGVNEPRVVVAFYCSFQSRNCGSVWSDLVKLQALFAEDMRLVFRHLFDDDDPNQPAARLAHLASLCADEQGAFWAYYDRAFSYYRSRRHRPRQLSMKDLEQTAGALGIDDKRFTACIEEGRYSKAVNDELAAVRKVGVSQTPSLVIGSRLYVGTRGLSELQALVEEQLRPGVLEQYFH